MDDYKRRKNGIQNLSIEIQDHDASCKVTSNIVKDSVGSNKLIVYKTIASNKGQLGGKGQNSNYSHQKNSMINRDNHTSLSGFRLNNSLETNDQGYFV